METRLSGTQLYAFAIEVNASLQVVFVQQIHQIITTKYFNQYLLFIFNEYIILCFYICMLKVSIRSGLLKFRLYECLIITISLINRVSTARYRVYY